MYDGIKAPATDEPERRDVRSAFISPRLCARLDVLPPGLADCTARASTWSVSRSTASVISYQRVQPREDPFKVWSARTDVLVAGRRLKRPTIVSGVRSAQ